MLMKKTLFLAVLTLLLGAVPAFSQSEEKEASDSAKIFFKLAKYDIDLNLNNNAAQFDRIFKSLEKAIKEGKVEKISIAATASPDGSYDFNQALSKNRADAIVKYITERYPLPERKIESISGGVAWDALRERVQKLDIEYKDEILRIIDEEPEVTVVNGKNVATRKNALQKLNGGKTYDWLYDNIFPDLRSGVALYLYLFPVPEDQMPQYLAEQAAKKAEKDAQDKGGEQKVNNYAPEEELVVEGEQDAPVAEQKPFYMGLKTNLVYDALLVPNIGVEFYLADNWSISAMVHYGWWNGRKAHDWWRTYGGEIEAKYWFGEKAREKPLQGHHVGIQLMAESYDFQFAGRSAKVNQIYNNLTPATGTYKVFDPEGYGWQSKYTYGAGVSYGYSLPIARRLNLDFEVALGFLGGDVQRYYVNPNAPMVDGELAPTTMDNCHEDASGWYIKDYEHEGASKFYMFSPKKSANPAGKPYYFGPTKVGVTLVYLIGYKNWNNK